MFHFAGTVLNNTRLEQVYYIYLTLHFISYSLGQKFKTTFGKSHILEKKLR